MNDFRTIGPAAAVYRLRLCGFSPREAALLVAPRIRYERGELDRPTGSDRPPLVRRSGVGTTPHHTRGHARRR